MVQRIKSLNERTETEMRRLCNAASEAWFRREALRHIPTAIEFDGVNSIDILNWVVHEHQARLAQLYDRLEKIAITLQKLTEKQKK